MNTLIIPLKNDGRYDQLRFALRSITKHHNITRCILVGGKPLWYTGEHIPHKDYPLQFKEANIRDKVLAGCSYLQASTKTGMTEPVSNRFLFANDDHILLQPLHEVYNKGLLSDCLSTRIGNGSCTRCLRNTFEHYGDVPNVDCHCPMWMTSEGVQLTNFEWPAFGIGFKTCYAQENGVHSAYMEDCKLKHSDPLPGGKQWFSIGDDYPVQKLVGLFPNISIFESAT